MGEENNDALSFMKEAETATGFNDWGSNRHGIHSILEAALKYYLLFFYFCVK